jgi:hypothetical protein
MQSRREPRPDFSLHSRFAIQNALAPLPHGASISSSSPECRHADEIFGNDNPTIGKSLIAPAVPLDDKLTPALQAADLLVGIVKDAALKWIADGRPRGGVAIDLKWRRHFAEPIGVFDGQQMLRSIKKTSAASVSSRANSQSSLSRSASESESGSNAY